MNERGKNVSGDGGFSRTQNNNAITQFIILL